MFWSNDSPKGYALSFAQTSAQKIIDISTTNEHSFYQVQFSRLLGKCTVSLPNQICVSVWYSHRVGSMERCNLSSRRLPLETVRNVSSFAHLAIVGFLGICLVSMSSCILRAFCFLRPLVCLIWLLHLTSSFLLAPSLTLLFFFL